ncbi:acyl-CoA thioester hydrolase YciA [Buchnera aphidicola (Thelaxes californica)]|uniref:Acyl-CoA thioester hydrolase YciA n=1 Tax=Buchnera aphidicola (Thelaxes californica) TaxID=1315998 RepID=A0A4D6Y9Q9_9GAMM|nr:acyl-CoA thioester hydrolase YciA [Buchnera aphidicola]QCI26746.1 acyl-CoA thioester hydrolase YciA [Buchnera aphidicola (Thelaxes californica)]
MKKKQQYKKKNYLPHGDIVLKTLAMPANANANGNIFGGWIMSQMDMGGAILSKEISGGKVTTVHVKSMTFFQSISIGDLVTCHAKIIKIGTTSITIKIEIWIKKVTSMPLGKYYKSTEATFIYVAINDVGTPRILPLMSII